MKKITPRAITMWDLSWLELRWRGAGYDLQRHPRRQSGYAVDDDRVAGFQPARNEPELAVPRPDLHRADLRLIVLVGQHDEVALRALQHRLLRHRDRVGGDDDELR